MFIILKHLEQGTINIFVINEIITSLLIYEVINNCFCHIRSSNFDYYCLYYCGNVPVYRICKPKYLLFLKIKKNIFVLDVSTIFRDQQVEKFVRRKVGLVMTFVMMETIILTVNGMVEIAVG